MEFMAELLPPIAMMTADHTPWIEAKNIGVVTDSPSVMRKARGTLLDEDMFYFAYWCASHAMSILCRDEFKLPKDFSALSFATTVVEFLSTATFHASISVLSATSCLLSSRR
jgi:hypothetical protein